MGWVELQSPASLRGAPGCQGKPASAWAPRGDRDSGRHTGQSQATLTPSQTAGQGHPEGSGTASPRRPGGSERVTGGRLPPVVGRLGGWGATEFGKCSPKGPRYVTNSRFLVVFRARGPVGAVTRPRSFRALHGSVTGFTSCQEGGVSSATWKLRDRDVWCP